HVALVSLRQPAGCHRGRGRRLDRSAGLRRPSARAIRPAGSRAGDRGIGRARLRVHRSGEFRLVVGNRDRPAHDQLRDAGSLRLPRSADGAPLLPLRILADRNRGGAYIVVALVIAGMFGAFLFLTYYLQAVLHYTPLQAGLAFLPLSVASQAGSWLIASSLMPHVAPRALMAPG